MSIKQPIMNEIIGLAATLSPEQQRQLAEQLMAMSDQQPTPKEPRPSLFGILAGHSVSEEEIAAARKEMWNDFPREDV